MPVFLELRAALWTPTVAGGHRHRAMMTLRCGADSLSTRWLLPLISISSGRVHGGVKGSSEEKCSCIRVLLFFLFNFAMDATFYFFIFFRFLDLLNWKLAVEDIASVIISEWRRRFLWTKQYIKVMHHRWINSCQWTLHSKSMLRFVCLFLCPSFVLSHRSGG